MRRMLKTSLTPTPDDSPDPLTPTFGEALPVYSSPATLAFLTRRRSASALTLGGPAPSTPEIERMLSLAARAPDHGKLAPWRFVILQGEAKQAFVAALESIAKARPDGVKLAAKLGKVKAPPLTIAVVSRYLEGEIPEWEQRLSAGAVCTLLIIAAQAMGWGANWITDWYAYDEAAAAVLGISPGERVAGFVHIGQVREAPLERVRPDLEPLITRWTPQRPR